MNKISPSLVQTWLTLSRSNDPVLNVAKNNAIRRISRIFGNRAFAEVYIEQAQDNEIEIFVL